MKRYVLAFLAGLALGTFTTFAADKPKDDKDAVEITPPMVTPPSDCFCPICVYPDSYQY